MKAVLSVVFEAKPGKEKQVAALLADLIDPSLKEEGCIQYDLHISTENPHKFFFFEVWATKALLDAHSEAPHVQSARAKIGDLLAGPPEKILWEKI